MTITAIATDDGHDRNNCEACHNVSGIEVIKHLEEIYGLPDHKCRFVDTPDGRKCYDCGEKVDLSESQEMIIAVCDGIKEMLIEKNRKYGNSALNPISIFSSSDTKEQIRVRIDDKLNRIRNQQIDDDEDAVDDLMGYLVLHKVFDRMVNDPEL